MACFEQALGALPHLPEDRDTLEQAVDLRIDLRRVLFPLGEVGRVFEYLHEAETLARALDDQRRLGRVSASMAQYFWATGEPDRAIELGQRGLEIAAALGDLGIQVVSHFVLGLAYHAGGDYSRAIDLFARNVASLSGVLIRERFGLSRPGSLLSVG